MRFLIVPFCALTALAQAQTVPADLLDMSLEQLFNIEIAGASGADEGANSPRWTLGYSVIVSDYRRYFDSNQKLSYDDVLWTPGTEARTGRNYPVVPTEIEQRVHTVSLGYRYNEHWGATVVVPYVQQSTDHISVVPGYDSFTISSDGVGDIGILPSYRWTDARSQQWQASFGFTLPTGSIDEEGDTPRGPGDQQLPYTMQLGSGTYDIVSALSLEGRWDLYSYGGKVSGKARLGETDRGYTLGNALSGTVWLGYEGWRDVRPSIALTYWRRGKISGEDKELRSASLTFPYPAPVVDPSRFGGDQLEIAAKMTLPLSSTGLTLDLEYRLPLWRDLNGPQSAMHYVYRVGVQYGF